MSAFAGNPWEELMGPGKGNIWSEPNGRFSVNLPVNWKHVQSNNKGVVQFSKHHKDHGQKAFLTVEMTPLPPGVRLSHFNLKTERELKKTTRNLRKGETSKITVSGQPARKTTYAFQERGHALRTNYALRVTLVDGERGWTLTFLTAYGAQGIFMEEIEKMISSFTAGTSRQPVRRPKKRRKLRAGEMVNPNLLKY